jgi:hypothetical protein
MSQRAKDVLHAQGPPDSGEFRRAPAELRQDGHSGPEDGPHRLESALNEALRAHRGDGAIDVGSPHLIDGAGDASGTLDGVDDGLDLIKRTRHASGEKVGQEADGAPSDRAPEARDPSAHRPDSGVRPELLEPAAASGMEGAPIEACVLPGSVPNVAVAGGRVVPS